MSAQRISPGENDPVGPLKNDQKASSDRFCNMDNLFLCLTYSLNSI